MDDTAITSFLNKLEYMLSVEVDSLHGFEDQLWSLHCLLTWRKSIIMEVERKQKEDSMEHRKEAMEKFVMEVITLVHKAKDVTDSYLNTIKKGNASGSLMDEAHKFRSEINRIMESHAWLPGFTESSTFGTCSSLKRPPPPIEDGDDYVVVVLEDEVKRMIDLLRDEDQDGRCEVIPVVGRGGLGKTTLARKVYYEKTIVEHFPCRSWIYVSNDYKAKELLQDILKQITKPTIAASATNNNDDEKERKEMKNLKIKDLAIEIYKHLRNPTLCRRYLIVFDDVCNAQFWANINIVFPNNKRGSRIIFATRHDEVAFHARPSRPPFYLRPLSKEERWALFSKKVNIHVDFNTHSQLEKKHHLHRHQWEEWINACDGLPLTVIALAEEYHRRHPLLSMIDNKKNDKSGNNEKDDKSDSDHKKVDESSSDKILPLGIWELIYNGLPHHLKMCLTYLDVLKGEGYPFFIIKD